MTLLEEIQQRLSNLPLEKQSEVLDFVAFLQERVGIAPSARTKAKRKERIKSAFATLATHNTEDFDWIESLAVTDPLA